MRLIIVSCISLLGCACIGFFSFPMQMDSIYLTPIGQFVLGLVGFVLVFFFALSWRLKLLSFLSYAVLWFGSCSINNFESNAKSYLAKREKSFEAMADVLLRYGQPKNYPFWITNDTIIIRDSSITISKDDKVLLCSLAEKTGHHEVYVENGYIFFSSARMLDNSRGIAYTRAAMKEDPYSFGGGLKIVYWYKIDEHWFYYVTG